jgi:hypothetical protein
LNKSPIQAFIQEREREKKVGGGSERHYRFGVGCNRNIIWQFGKGEACIGDFLNFDFKDAEAAVVGEM